MNIAFVNATKKWGGVKTWCLDMALALRAQGHGTFICGRSGAFVDKAGQAGVPARAVSFGFDFNPLAIAAFVWFFLTRRVDVVVVNVARDLRTAGVAARLLGLQVVQHVGSGADFDDTRLVRLVQRLVRPRLICCSEYVRGRIVAHVPCLAAFEVAALHPGTDMARAPAYAQNIPPVIVATSQLNDDKRHADLLAALARLQGEGLAFRALIAGTGRLEGELKRQASDLGLTGLIEWAGFTTDVPGLLARGDIFVLPTLVEPLGIALQEAMAAGLAPVARAAGGVPEIWPSACAASLAGPEPGPDGLCDALRRLLALTPAELLALRRAVRVHAEAAFELGRQAARFADWLGRPLRG